MGGARAASPVVRHQPLKVETLCALSNQLGTYQLREVLDKSERTKLCNMKRSAGFSDASSPASPHSASSVLIRCTRRGGMSERTFTEAHALHHRLLGGTGSGHVVVQNSGKAV